MFNILGFIGQVALCSFTATLITQAIFALIPLLIALVAFLTSSGAAAIFIAGGFLTLMNRINQPITRK